MQDQKYFWLFFQRFSLKLFAVMSPIKQFPHALRRVIELSYSGNQSDFAEITGMTAASVSRLCAGTREITSNTLAKITKNLSETDKRKLCLAAIRDFLPQDCNELFFPSPNKEPMIRQEDETDYGSLDSETIRILKWLNCHARSQPEVRSWLKTLSKWIQP
jgi:hypothetical protein